MYMCVVMWWTINVHEYVSDAWINKIKLFVNQAMSSEKKCLQILNILI